MHAHAHCVCNTVLGESLICNSSNFTVYITSQCELLWCPLIKKKKFNLPHISNHIRRDGIFGLGYSFDILLLSLSDMYIRCLGKKRVEAGVSILYLWMTRVARPVVAVPSQGPAHPQQLQDWPPNTTSFHQLPPGRPSSPLFVMVFRVVDHSWPVAMADCCMCTTPGPFIPNL